MIRERNDCRLCGGAVHGVLALTPTPLANSFQAEPWAGRCYPLGLKQCEDCGHVQISHVVADAALFHADYAYQTPAAQLPALCTQARALRQRFPRARLALEIGANNGLNLHALFDAGFAPVIGIDPAGADPLVWKLPFNIDTAHLVLRRSGPADLVVANNVFAHIDDLDAVFEGIDEVLSGTGTLVFEVQYLPALMEAGAFDMIYHEHRDYHTLRPLRRFMARHSLAIAAVEYLPNHGGSIRVYADRGVSRAPLPVEDLDWKAFRARIEAARVALRRTLAAVRPVIAFGASAKACTLIHHFGLGDQIAFAVDCTPAKQGKYIPGTGIRILSEEALQDHDGRSVLLTAWNYAELLRRRYPRLHMIEPFAAGEAGNASQQRAAA